MQAIFRYCLLLSFSFSIQEQLFAQWIQTNGPTGANVSCTIIKDSNIFVGTDGGVYCSTDNGISWKPVNTGLANKDILALAANGNGIFAGTNGGGIFRSINNGLSWSAFNDGLADTVISSIALNDSMVFAGAPETVYALYSNGSSWSRILNMAEYYGLSVIYISDSNLIVTGSYGLVYNLNTNATTLMDSTIRSYDINTIMSVDSSIYAGTVNGIFLSKNNGVSWTSVSPELASANVRYLASDHIHLFAATDGGLVVLSDTNNIWQPLYLGLTGVSVAALLIQDSSVFAGSEESGMFYSSDLGLTWTPDDSGLTNLYTTALVFKDPYIFAGTPDHIYMSPDSGVNWYPSYNGLLPSCNVNAFAVIGNDIFAGVMGTNTSGGGGVYVSRDNGANWGVSGMGNSLVYGLAVRDSNIFTATGGTGIFRSTDSGANWYSVNNGLTSDAFYSIAFAGQNIFAGSLDQGMFVSADNGDSWTSINNGLDPYFPFLYINCLIASGANIFAGTSSGIFISINNGASWAPVNNGLPTLNIFCFAVKDGSVFAGTDQGVFVSTNQGLSWTSFNQGLTSRSISCLAVNNDNIFAGTNTGVWRYFYTERSVTGLMNDNSALTECNAGQNYPNPFSGVTTIPFTIASDTHLKIVVYNILGNEIATIADEQLSAGAYTRNWNSNEVPSGVYLYKMETDHFTQTKELTILK